MDLYTFGCHPQTGDRCLESPICSSTKPNSRLFKVYRGPVLIDLSFVESVHHSVNLKNRGCVVHLTGVALRECEAKCLGSFRRF